VEYYSMDNAPVIMCRVSLQRVTHNVVIMNISLL
jgi:hypothetical protein